MSPRKLLFLISLKKRTKQQSQFANNFIILSSDKVTTMMIRLSLWKLAIVGASVLVAGQSTTTAFIVSPRLSPAKTNNNGRRTVSENPATATATLAVFSTDDDEDSSTYTKAPPVTADLYDESITTLYGKYTVF